MTRAPAPRTSAPISAPGSDRARPGHWAKRPGMDWPSSATSSTHRCALRARAARRPCHRAAPWAPATSPCRLARRWPAAQRPGAPPRAWRGPSSWATPRARARAVWTRGPSRARPGPARVSFRTSAWDRGTPRAPATHQGARNGLRVHALASSCVVGAPDFAPTPESASRARCSDLSWRTIGSSLTHQVPSPDLYDKPHHFCSPVRLDLGGESDLSRALSLVRRYGGAPLPVSSISNLTQASPPRSGWPYRP